MALELFKKDQEEQNIKEILAPISKDNPVGDDIRNGAEYALIKHMREEDNLLPQGIWKYARKEAEWRKVELTCMDILKSKSKDSHVLIWLIESWGYLYGAQGILAALDLTDQFFQKYWKDMYPQVKSDEDWAYREHLIQLLDNKFNDFLKRVIIINPTIDEAHTYTLAEYNYTINKENNGTTGTTSLDEYDKYHYSKILQSASLTDVNYFIQTLEDSEEIIKSCENINTTLKKLSDLSELELYYTKEAAIEISQIAKSAIEKYKQKEIEKESERLLEVEIEKLKADEELAVPAPVEEGIFKGPKVTIHNVDEAFDIVQDVIHYLEQNQPNAIAKYMLSKACVMRTETFETMLDEFAKYDFDIKQLRYFLGIRG